MALIDKASLLMVPSTYEAGTLYNVLPSGNRAPDSTGENSGYDQTRADFDFDRGSNTAATRVNADGLIEKYRENLLLQSNQFDTTWINSNSTETGGQNGYDGSSDAWLINKSAANGYIRQAISQSGVQTLSVYAKAGTLNWMRVIADGGTSTPSTWFDLQNGVIGNADFFTIDSNIEAIGATGWYRCSITFEVGTIAGVRFYPADANNVVSGTSGSIYIQNAQLEQGLVATDYIESGATTGKAGVLIDLPRIDYSSGAGALLLEPSRQQLLQYSEYFYGSNWTAGTTTIVPVISPSLSPEGKLNAYRITRNDGLGQLQLGSLTSVTSGATYTGSFYVKRVSGSTTCEIFNLNNVGTSKNITDEWTRIDITSTANSTTGRLYIRPAADGDVIDVWGAQLEAGSYATSYIPNHGESGGVTRAADSCSVTGASDVIGQTEGTLFFDVNISRVVGNEAIGTINSGAYANHATIQRVGSTIQFVRNSATQSGATIVTSATITAGRYKLAIAYKSGDTACFLNGAQVSTTQTQTFTNATLNVVKIGTDAIGALPISDSVKQSILFKTRLTNTELADLTTL